LDEQQVAELVGLRDRAPQAYVRERAAALLKIAGGASVTAVAQGGLLRRRGVHTVLAWLKRYRAEGVAGLSIRPGRGRKPAFFPPERR
jgi:transposase